MTVFDRFCRALAMPLALVVLFVSLPINVAQSAMVTTDQVLAESQTESDRARVLDFLAREDVRQQIEAFGVDPDEAALRVQSLSDVEIAKIVHQMDQEPAGQSTVLVILGAVILTIFLIFIITDLTGATDVFPFINPI